MSRVFSLKEIENGLVPERIDFQDSLEGFSGEVKAAIGAGIIDGAAVFGSVALGSYTRRSDLDCMIVPLQYSKESTEAIRRIKGAANPNNKVQVNPILHSRARLASGYHEIDRFFMENLTSKDRLVFGIDPASYMRAVEQSDEEILYGYIHQKKRTVGELLHVEKSNQYKYIARLLELPLAIGRKALRTYDETTRKEVANGTTVEKVELGRRALTLFASYGLDEVPRSITELDRGYSDCLDSILSGALTELKYAQYLEEIKAIAPHAAQWLDDLEAAFREDN